MHRHLVRFLALRGVLSKIGDELILYAAGGQQKIFAKASVTSNVYGGGDTGWPHRLDVDYEINVSPENGVPIAQVSIDRDLSISVRRQSYIRLNEAEFDRALSLLEAADDGSISIPVPNKSKNNYFTTYWKNETWDENASRTPNGGLLDHTASDYFVERGIVPGDAVYIVTVKKGKLFVATKITVGQLCTTVEAAKVLGTTNLWNAYDHIISSESTPIDWDFELPINITEQLEFLSAKGVSSPLTFKSPQFLDEQTLRGVRRLSPDSAELIDNLLPPQKPITSLWIPTGNPDELIDAEFESFADGMKNSKFVTFYERDPKNRAAAVQIHGYTCKGCHLNFEQRYGSLGKDYIHVHHIKPVSQYEKPKKIDPVTDLTVLCPNCHAMVHRKKTDTLSVERLRELIKATDAI